MRNHAVAWTWLAVVAHAQVPAQVLPGVSVQGRVVDVLGDGVPVAAVEVLGENGDVLGRAVADGDGLFQVRKLPDLPLRLRVTAKGKVVCALPLPPGGAVRALQAVLEDAGTLRGTITAPDGMPVAGAFVLAMACGNGVGGNHGPWVQETRSDDRGVYSIAGAPLRQISVRAWLPGRELTTARTRLVGDGTCDVVLSPARWRARRVTVANLAPDLVATSHLALSDGNGAPMLDLPQPLRCPSLQRDGTAELPQLSFFHEVSLAVPGFASQPLRIRCAAGASQELAFTVAASPERQPPLTRIAGQVIDDQGHGLAGTRVLCSDRQGQAMGSAPTDAEGRFEMTVPLHAHAHCQVGLANGPWRLASIAKGDTSCAVREGVTWLATTADPGEPRLLTAERAGAIRGDARAQHGAPLAFAAVEVFELTGHRPRWLNRELVLQSATDRSGHCELLGLRAGTYQVVVRDCFGCAGYADVELAAGGSVDFGRIVLVATGDVAGVVCNEQGQPMPGVRVGIGWARDVGAGGNADIPPPERLQGASCLTDRRGRFRARGLPAGTCQIRVDSGQRPETTQVEVKADAVTTVDLTAR